MLPFHMLAALPTHPSPTLDPFVPLFSSLFSVTSATSALKSPRSPIAEFHRAAQPPNHFPLFPHPVNIAHAGTPANLSFSTIYFTTSVYPGGGGPAAPCIIFKTAPTPVTPLDATLTKKRGAPPRQPCTALPRYSLHTTHYSPSPPIRYTIHSRHT